MHIIERVPARWELIVAASLSVMTSASLVVLLTLLARLGNPGAFPPERPGDRLGGRDAGLASTSDLRRPAWPSFEVTTVPCPSTVGTLAQEGEAGRIVLCRLGTTEPRSPAANGITVVQGSRARTPVLAVLVVFGWLLGLVLIAGPSRGPWRYVTAVVTAHHGDPHTRAGWGRTSVTRRPGGTRYRDERSADLP